MEKNINIKIKINLNGEKSEKERKLAIKSNLNEYKTYKILYWRIKFILFFLFYPFLFSFLDGIRHSNIVWNRKKKVATITIVKIKTKMALP